MSLNVNKLFSLHTGQKQMAINPNKLKPWEANLLSFWSGLFWGCIGTLVIQGWLQYWFNGN